MNVRAWLATLAMLLLAPLPATAQLPAGCAPADRACVMRVMREHPVRLIDLWRADLARPLDTRIGAAPPLLVDYLGLDNLANGFPQRPRAAVLEPVFLQDLRDAIAQLPPQVWRLFGERLIGVYLVDDLGSTGFSDAVRDSAGRRVAGYIVLDAGVLRPLTANAWATWKERTPFKSRDGYRLAAQIEAEAHDNRVNAIQYILLHELAHVLSIANTMHPPWDIRPKDLPLFSAHPFFDLSWRIDRWADRYVGRLDDRFPQRRDVIYYRGAKLEASQMAQVYANLQHTDFPTLYAATSPGDDFAESFASYVHVVLQGRPWQITISRPGAADEIVPACWDQPRCQPKRRLLEEILAR